eukprot:SAG25_NODE_12948_length_273_cov_0.873563_1_plen_74_part_10
MDSLSAWSGTNIYLHLYVGARYTSYAVSKTVSVLQFWQGAYYIISKKGAAGMSRDAPPVTTLYAIARTETPCGD